MLRHQAALLCRRSISVGGEQVSSSWGDTPAAFPSNRIGLESGQAPFRERAKCLSVPRSYENQSGRRSYADKSIEFIERVDLVLAEQFHWGASLCFIISRPEVNFG